MKEKLLLIGLICSLSIALILAHAIVPYVMNWANPPIETIVDEEEFQSNYFNLITVRSKVGLRKICTGPAIFVDTINYGYCETVRVTYLTDSTMEKMIDTLQAQLESEK